MQASSQRIEQMAVNAIRDLITDTCPLLIANITSNEKTPFIDGDIAIYKTKEIKNENSIGKVPVQVKGKTYAKFPTIYTYQIKVNDLRHYLLNGGAIYFVVAISKQQKVICYSPLSVVKIQNILSSIEDNQKTVSIRLSKFPTEENKIMDVVRNFYEDSRKQHSFAKEETHPLEYWQKNPNFQNLSINAICYGNKQPSQMELIESVNSHENYIYVKLDNCPIPIPVSNENIKLGLLKEGKEPVTVGSKIYYDNFRIIRDEKAIQVQFGDAFVYTMHLNKTHDSEFIYNCPAQIDKAVRAMEFIKAIKIEKQFKIGDVLLNNMDFDVTYEELEQQENQLRNIANLLTTLHIDIENFKYNELSQHDLNNLQLLHRAIVKNEIIKETEFRLREDFENSVLCDIKINDKIIQVLVTKEAGGYKIEDKYNLNKIFFLEKTDGNFEPATPYYLLTAENYNQILNVNYQGIIETYKELYEKYPPIINQAIFVLNTILIAFDQSKNINLLRTAIGLNEWLQDKEIEDISPNAKKLSTLEIAYRHRELTKIERKFLYNIVAEAQEPLDILYAYILLGDIKGANDTFNDLCDDCKNYFKHQSIYYLFENMRMKS